MSTKKKRPYAHLYQEDNISKRVEDSTITFASGAISTNALHFEYIPLSALEALAKRMGRGVRIKGKEGTWNATSNLKIAEDKEFVINRLSHGIDHCYKAIARIIGSLPECDEQETEDGGDAGAIMFAGTLLAEYKSRGK
jgi:hypothetical protein